MVDYFMDGTRRITGYHSSRGFKKASIRHDNDAKGTKHRTRFARQGECACGWCRSCIYRKRLLRRQRRLRDTRETRIIMKEVLND